MIDLIEKRFVYQDFFVLTRTNIDKQTIILFLYIKYEFKYKKYWKIF